MKNFLINLSEQLEDNNVVLSENTKLNDIEGWDSLTIMMVIGMVKLEYKKDISALEINECVNVSDLLNLVIKK